MEWLVGGWKRWRSRRRFLRAFKRAAERFARVSYTPARHEPTLDDFRTAITGGDVIRHQECGGRVRWRPAQLLAGSPPIYGPRWVCECGAAWTPARVEAMGQAQLASTFFRRVGPEEGGVLVLRKPPEGKWFTTVTVAVRPDDVPFSEVLRWAQG